jgi:hypothetical protein
LIEVNAQGFDSSAQSKIHVQGGVAMSPNEAPTKWPSPFSATDFAKFGKEQADTLAEMQKELSRLAEQANADWMSRMELERDLASELGGKLSQAKNPADAAKAYQDWMGRRVEIMSKDSQKFFADTQKFVTAMTRFLTGGRSSNS